MRQPATIGRNGWNKGAAPYRDRPDRKGSFVIKRILGASLRAFLVFSLLTGPSLLLPAVSEDTTQLVVLSALVLSFWVFLEYFGSAPVLLDFTRAAPVNRYRFLVAAVMLATSILISLGHANGYALAALSLGSLIDLPFTPVRLLTLASDGDAFIVSVVGSVVVIAAVALGAFAALVRWVDWPLNAGAFNVHTNLPLFDPTSGEDVLARLKRDKQINVVLAFAAPLLLPVLLDRGYLSNALLSGADAHTAIWTLTLWAIMPVSFGMRAIALGRVATLVAEKRRRAYAQREPSDDGWQLA